MSKLVVITQHEKPIQWADAYERYRVDIRYSECDTILAHGGGKGFSELLNAEKYALGMLDALRACGESAKIERRLLPTY